MKNLSFVAVLVTLTSTYFAADVATSKPGPTISPSVKAAHRFKYNPPRNWIRHYLGDDRYKIAGGIWKVVTTPNDKFYYPAYAAEMLRRSPNNVIGFASADEALEAGYAPHPAYFASYNANDASFTAIATQDVRSEGSSGMKSRYRSLSRVLRAGSRARRIVLDDQRSSAILPRGWSYARSAPQNVSGTVLSANYLLSPDKKLYVIFMMGTSPEYARSVSSVTVLSDKLRAMMQKRNNSGRINTQLNREVNATLRTATRLGGLPAMTALSSEFPDVMPVPNSRVTVAAQGDKFYMAITPVSAQSNQVRTILNSFRPR